MAGTNPGQYSSDPAVSGAAWVQPQPQAVLGLSSSAIYGTSFTSTFPQSFQVATGGLFKLVVDPVGFCGAFPEVKEAGGAGALGLLNLCASGVQGNVQVTLGTVANLAMGLSYNIHLGDEVEIKSKDKIAPRLLSLITGGILAVGAIAFQIAYDMTSRDDDRATLVLAFQTAVEAIVTVLLAIDVAYYELDKKSGYLYREVYVADAKKSVADATVDMIAASIIAALAGGMVLGAAILPPILDSAREGTLKQLLKGTKSTDPPAGSGASISVSDQGTPS